MTDPTDDDMDQPITKRDALDLFLTKREFHDVMKNLFEYLDRRFDRVETNLKSSFKEELARHTSATHERHQTELSVIDDKYKDLPDRVTKIEAKVFAPKRQRRR